jgi:hypothetical protein
MICLVGVALCCTLASCEGTAAGREDEKKAAIAAAETWLELVDEGKYGESWENAAAFFKRVVTTQQWLQQIEPIRNALGKVQLRELKGAEYRTALPGAPDGEYVVIQFTSSFEHKKKAVETVTPMLDDDGTWRVSGYYIE